MKTWILVADGAHGRLYESEGKGKDLKLVRSDDSEAARKRSRDIDTDAPGRTFDSAGPGARHAMAPPTDPKDHAEYEFVRDLAEVMRDGVVNHKCDRVVIVAPARALGNLREVLDHTVKERISAEVNKDLVKSPPKDLREHLEKEGAL